VEEKIKAMIGKIVNAGVNSVVIKNEQCLQDDLAFDSLDLIELAFALEDAFEADFDDLAIAKLTTVQDVIDLVVKSVAAKKKPA